MVDCKRHLKRIAIGFSLSSLFLLVVGAGHFYSLVFTFLCAFGMCYELFSLKNTVEATAHKPLFRILSWHFFITYVYTIFGYIIKRSTSNTQYAWIFHMHIMNSFILFMLGTIIFVLTLKQGHYKKQFSLFGWIHLTCLVIIGGTGCATANLFKGTIWLLYPIIVVTLNDAFAYMFGVTMGKTKLIKISPNKTWEGFIGGYVLTCVFGILLSFVLPYIKPLTCIPTDLSFIPFDYSKCTVNPAFAEMQDNGNQCVASHLENSFLIHAYVISLFAGLLAPFGGFFASGFKRALLIKDFGTILPGHGGLTDRFDCILLSLLFVNVYTEQYAKVISVTMIMELAKTLKLSQLDELIMQLTSWRSSLALTN